MLSHRILKKHSLHGLLAAAALAVPLTLSDGAQASYSCKGYYKAQGSGDSKAYALSAAISAWSAWVASHYGSQYDNWNYAQYKSVSCSQYNYSWTCTVYADACYYYAPPTYYKPPHPYSGGGYSSGGGGSGY
jgi:hypothetical protein